MSRLAPLEHTDLVIRPPWCDVWDVTVGGGIELQVPDIWRLTLGPVQSAWTLALWPQVGRADRLHSYGPLMVGTELEVVVDSLDTETGITAPGGWILGNIIAVQRLS